MYKLLFCWLLRSLYRWVLLGNSTSLHPYAWAWPIFFAFIISSVFAAKKAKSPAVNGMLRTTPPTADECVQHPEHRRSHSMDRSCIHPPAFSVQYFRHPSVFRAHYCTFCWCVCVCMGVCDKREKTLCPCLPLAWYKGLKCFCTEISMLALLVIEVRDLEFVLDVVFRTVSHMYIWSVVYALQEAWSWIIAWTR